MRKFIAAGSLYLTSAPITPREVTLKFSKIFVLVEVFKKGYKKSGMWAKNIYKNYHLRTIGEFDDGVLNIGVVQLQDIFCWMRRVWDWVVEIIPNILKLSIGVE